MDLIWGGFRTATFEMFYIWGSNVFFSNDKFSIRNLIEKNES